jgi:hypothetical protein
MGDWFVPAESGSRYNLSMRAYGSDRVRPSAGERVVIASRLSKGWVARVGKTLTSAEFPGTAVRWEEQYFEVVEARALEQGGVEYVLEPWLDHHVMRVVEAYDGASEAARIAAYREHLAREKGRKAANALALLTGHLPAVVQEAIAADLGVLPNRISFISIIGEYAVVVGFALWIVSYLTRREPPPFVLIVVAAYLAIETTARFFVNYTQSRPIGSSVGLVAYIVWWLVTGRRATSPFAVSKGWNVVISDTPDERRMHDLLVTREALLTLLPAGDQQRIAERFGYDYRRQSTIIAAGILFFSVIGIASSLARDAFVSFVVACALAGEQIYRLAVMRHRPVGSVFGVLVRPFVRKFLRLS